MKVKFGMVDNVFYQKYYGLGIMGNNNPSVSFSGEKTVQPEDVSLFSASNKYTQNDSVSEYGQVRDIIRKEKERGNAEYPSPPVNIFAQNKYNNSEPKPKKAEEEYLVTSCALKTFSPYRRAASIPNEISQGQFATAAGVAAVTAVNFPEDLRDVKNGIEQIKAFFKGEKYIGKYDFKTLQHPFSFFRGTLLHRFADPGKSKNPELAQKLFDSDKTMAQTKFGKEIINIFGAKKIKQVRTEIHSIGSTKENPRFVKANVYDGSKFGILTAHALERTTKWGLAITALLEAPQIIKELCHGDNIGEKGENGTKQVFKSAMNVALTTAGIGYMGAIGNKYGPLFSLAGMAAGAVIGGYGSRKIQDCLS